MFARWLTRTRWGAGEEVGAANVVKLGGNFLIASAIEAMAESLALAEANGVDRVAMMEMLNSTIFDCLIYKGYGQRVSERDHLPYPDAHFALELGLKDVSLVSATAAASSTPMPLCSLLILVGNDNGFVSSHISLVEHFELLASLEHFHVSEQGSVLEVFHCGGHGTN